MIVVPGAVTMSRGNKRERKGVVRSDMISGDAPLDAAHAERLLSGAVPAGDDSLSWVISAATAPPYPSELAGEDEAVRALQLARRAYVATPSPVPPQRHRRSPWGWALVAKAAGVLLATVGAGWALAASTGVLPAPWEDSPPATPISTSAPVVHPSSTGTASPAAATVDPSTGAAQSTAPPATTPASTLQGLCQAFVAQGEDPDLLDNPGFARLVTEAGGADNVPAFCHDLLSSATPTPTAT
jgi:hypothetical protein